MAYQGRATGLSLSKLVEGQLQEVQNRFLSKMADAIVTRSPVWSGEYVSRHAIEGRSAQGQFASNLEGWKPKTANPVEVKESARANLQSSISSLAIGNSVAFTNRVPHAYIVEKIGWRSPDGSLRVPPYEVYTGAATMANTFLQEAVNEVKSL